MWKIRTNFKNLLSVDEWLIFEELLEVYDKLWLVIFNYVIQSNKGLREISEKSYLNKFIIEVVKWNSPEFVIQNLLEENQVDIDNSPLFENSKEFKWFVEGFRFMVDRLIYIWNPWFIDTNSGQAN
jgi:hypothetical protein